MAEVRRADLGAYVLGRLDEVEAARVRRWVEASGAARAEEAELREVVRLLRATGPLAPPAGLEERVLAAVDAAERPPVDELAARRAGRGPRRVRRAVAAASVAAALVLGGVVGAVAFRGGDAVSGVREVAGTLRGPGGTAQATVTLVPEGRVVEVRSDTLPVLPRGTFYELWFVAADGARISAGTWHPAPDGRTDVRFLVAADPALLPRIEVTREVGGRDPGPTGPAVLRYR